MKLGIIGTRGIPNRYGGFEQFTEYVAPALVERGHEVFVYNSSLHPYHEKEWKGVKLIKKFDPERQMGTAGQFIYDLNCILDARKRNFDVILQLGYTSSSIWHFLFPKKAKIVTNMDGLEWKRTKYSKKVQQFLKMAERWAALKSDRLIADSIGIQQYLATTYQKSSDFIAYGAHIFNTPDAEVLKTYGLEPFQYNLVIARMEPENHIETILKGHSKSLQHRKLVLIGNYQNQFGEYLFNTYKNNNTIFLGPIYDIKVLNNLRYFSHLYFHGHSVGGTNPSLLEAMASNAFIIAHDNIFNKSVLGEDAFYFSDPEAVCKMIDSQMQKGEMHSQLNNNIRKIQTDYNWDHITQSLEATLLKSLHGETA